MKFNTATRISYFGWKKFLSSSAVESKKIVRRGWVVPCPFKPKVKAYASIYEIVISGQRHYAQYSSSDYGTVVIVFDAKTSAAIAQLLSLSLDLVKTDNWYDEEIICKKYMPVPGSLTYRENV